MDHSIHTQNRVLLTIFFTLLHQLSPLPLQASTASFIDLITKLLDKTNLPPKFNDSAISVNIQWVST